MNIGLSRLVEIPALEAAFAVALPGLRVPVVRHVDDLPRTWDLWVLVEVVDETDGTAEFPVSLVVACALKSGCDHETWCRELARTLSEQLALRTVTDGSSLGPTDAPFWCVVWDQDRAYLADDSEEEEEGHVRLVRRLDPELVPVHDPADLAACVAAPVVPGRPIS